ncbi:MAG: hypothetical protein K8T25_19455 [Planctomycetia bacterium]|nr:hypothetical protein [Planctomycetia bacterium]
MNPPPKLAAHQEVDFLPAHFREDTEKRKGQNGRFVVVLLFALLMPVASFFQHRVRHGFERQIALIEPECALAANDAAKLKALEAKLQRVESTAQLVTYLRHPWPRSQMLSALLPAMPKSIVLGSVHIIQVTHGATHAAQPVNNNNLHQEGTAEIAPKLTQVERDLQMLRAQNDPMRVEMLLAGTAADPTQLHEYLSELARNPLFVRSELESLEQVPTAALSAADAPKADTAKPVRFRVRLVVRTGYGQPNGPAVIGGKQVAAQPGGTFTAAIKESP